MRVGIDNLIHLENSIRVLCKIIKQNEQFNNPLSEYTLRRELVACILGSQVRYEMASTALRRIERAGLLKDKWWSVSEELFETMIFKELSRSDLVTDSNWCYRFPKKRARQLAKARDAIAEKSLIERVLSYNEPKKIRRQLVSEITGIGPKQASMFIRNIGISYDLAILDTHVLQYLSIKKVLDQEQMRVSTISAYEKTESVVIKYADSLGYPIGYLDWAIWATMRAARELSL
ncbi:DNA lyase [Candidatus Micrarchaeota archaeon]|jgi:N-glycosylase/DNA lyase|nr:DNA lyase [Candidatus Micrarchaeota archaeon]